MKPCEKNIVNGLLCAAFFLSGMSALVFESLWFQLASVTFGSSIWATSIVLAGFMGGLALGNVLAALYGYRLRRPVLAYVFLEIAIGVSGIGLVFLFPHLTRIFAPLFRSLFPNIIFLNCFRAATVFLLMLIPTTAMGATLPFIVKAVNTGKNNFGNVLGMLYGWNTLGAVLGVLANEIIFVKNFGINGAGVAAAACNVFAAMIALAVLRRGPEQWTLAGAACAPLEKAYRRPVFRLLSAGFMSGFIFLALEVIWFRFLILFFDAYSWNFSIILATVLGGISIGGFISGRWFAGTENAQRFLSPLAGLSVILLVALYGLFKFVLPQSFIYGQFYGVMLCSFFLIFPVACVSGIIFPMLGAALQKIIPAETKAAGLLTLANTCGAMCGALIAEAVFIPRFGVEHSFFLLAVFYAVMMALVFPETRDPALSFKAYRKRQIIMATAVIAAILLFPFGYMKKVYLERPIEVFEKKYGEHRIALREGLNETVQYLRNDLAGNPYYYRLVTNSHSMATTRMEAKRYMNLYVYWPVAVNADARSALLIAYGTGTTAKALTDTDSLSSVDIVDLSRDVIAMSGRIYRDPKSNPVNDPRVKVYIEDGRFFLQTTAKNYDIITAEPPPPRYKGIVNLYSQEYFQLIYNRLNEGGIVTYWLPVDQLEAPEAKAILKAFCNVFEHSSLWMGNAFDCMMVGIKGRLPAVTEKNFRQQWDDPVVGPQMQMLGFDSPQQLGAQFIADGKTLRDWLGNTRPLLDNYPQRLSHVFRAKKQKQGFAAYWEFLDYKRSKDNFFSSEQITRIWPAALRQATEPYFLLRQFVFEAGQDRNPIAKDLDRFRRNEPLHKYIPWALASNEYAWQVLLQHFNNTPDAAFRFLAECPQACADAVRKGDFPQAQEILDTGKHIAAKAVQLQKYTLAEGYYAAAAAYSQGYDKEQWTYLRMYLLFLAGEPDKAHDVGKQFIRYKADGIAERKEKIDRFLDWMKILQGKV